jgi:hypothetical protein
MKKKIFIFLLLIAFLIVWLIPFELPEMENKEGNFSIPYENLSETYPEHPKLEDCEKTSKKDFCIGDVAEINQNLDLCQQIQAYDIRTFCIARLSLNKTMCQEIADKGLSDSCVESIEMKTGHNA